MDAGWSFLTWSNCVFSEWAQRFTSGPPKPNFATPKRIKSWKHRAIGKHREMIEYHPQPPCKTILFLLRPAPSMAIPIPLHRKPLISCKITWSSRSISWCFKFYSYVEIYVSGMYIAEDVGILKCWFPLYGCSWSSHVCRFISHFCWLNSHVCRSKSYVYWEIRFHQQMSKKSSPGCENMANQSSLSPW